MNTHFLESQYKYLALSRNNGEFASGEAGAYASAGLYALLAAASANGPEPLDDLSLNFKKPPTASRHEIIESLLPYNAQKSQQLRSCEAKK